MLMEYPECVGNEQSCVILFFVILLPWMLSVCCETIPNGSTIAFLISYIEAMVIGISQPWLTSLEYPMWSAALFSLFFGGLVVSSGDN